VAISFLSPQHRLYAFQIIPEGVKLSPYLINTFLWDPVGKDMHDQVLLGWIVGDKVDSEIVGTVHTFVHHEYGGFNRCALPGF